MMANDRLKKLQEQILSNAHTLHSKGHDQTKVFNALNAGADDGVFSRFGYGLREFTSDGAKTLGKWTGNKEWEREADANLKYIRSRENAWKRKEARDTGRDEEDIWNVSGGFGQVMPYLAGGIAGGASKATTLGGRALGNVGRGLTPDLGLSLMEHGHKDTMNKDVALDVGLGVLGVAGGQVLGDKVISPAWKKFRGRNTPAPEAAPKANAETDDMVARGLSAAEDGEQIPPIFNPNRKPPQVEEKYRVERTQPEEPYTPNFRMQPNYPLAKVEQPKTLDANNRPPQVEEKYRVETTRPAAEYTPDFRMQPNYPLAATTQEKPKSIQELLDIITKKQEARKVPEQYKREVIDPDYNPRADYEPDFTRVAANPPVVYKAGMDESSIKRQYAIDALAQRKKAAGEEYLNIDRTSKPQFVPKVSNQQRAARDAAGEKREILEKMYGGDEDKIKEALSIKKKLTKSTDYSKMDDEAIKAMDENYAVLKEEEFNDASQAFENGHDYAGRMPQSLDTDAVPPELIQKAASGDKQAFEDVAGAVFSRTFERIVNKNTGDELKPLVLDKLIDNPNLVEGLAEKFGYKMRYFTSNPDNVGKKIGDTVVEERPQTRQKLKKQGYEAGNIWVYDPYDTHGSFNDAEYTKAWRGIHELSHAITERIMQAKYGDSRRFGALGNDTKNPYDKTDPRTYKALTAEEAQRAVEWEDVAFRTQLRLLDGMGIKINKQEAMNDFNIAGSDTVIRTLTGDFSDPANLGVIPRKDDYRLNVKSVLELMNKQEGALAKHQGREATRGIDTNNWKEVGDAEIEAVIKDAMDNPLMQPQKLDGVPSAQMSIEAVAGKEVDEELKSVIQSLPEPLQAKYHEELYKALTDQSGTSIIAKKLGLEVGEYNNLAGVWKSEVNPSAQIQVKSEMDEAGNLTDAFKSKLDDMAEIYAVAFKQDGVGWHYPVHTTDDIVEQNGLEFIIGKKLSKEDAIELEKSLNNEIKDGFVLASTEKGVRILNTSELPNQQFHTAVENVLEGFKQSGSVSYFRAESNLIQGIKNGDNITQNSLKRRPDLQEWFNTHIAEQTERVNQRFTAIAKENGYQARASKEVADPNVLHASQTATGAAIGTAVGATNDLDGDGKITAQDLLLGLAGGAAGGKILSKSGKATEAAEKFLNKGIQQATGKTLHAADHLTGKVVSRTWNAAKESDIVDLFTGHKIYGKTDYMALREKMFTSLNKNQVNNEALHRQLTNLSEGARENLYKYMTGEKTVALSPDLKRFANEYTETITAKGKELVELGVLEAAQLEKFKGMYLHRRYEKHLQATGSQTFRKGNTIQGVHARGNTWVGTKKEYEKLAADGELGKFTEGKTEAHRMANGKYRFSKDWTPEQRKKWGEVQDIAYSLPETLGRLDDMIANATMLKKMADESPYVVNEATEGFSRLEGKKFGSLNGKYVADDVANDITAFAENMHGLPNGVKTKLRQAWKDYLSTWKASHTIYNGKAHMNNLISNITFQFMEGVSPDKAIINAGKGAHAYFKVNRLKELDAKKLVGLNTEEAAELKVLRQDEDVSLFMQAEGAGLFGRSALNDILFKYVAPKTSTGWDKSKGALANIHNKAANLYQGEDNVMRFSLLKALTGKGIPFDEAISQVNKTIPDYSKPMSQVARGARETGIVPFISWTYYSMPIMIRQLKSKPARALAIPAIMYGLYESFGIDPYNEKDLPQEGYSFKRVPIYKNGNEVTTLKVDKWLPHGELLNPIEFARGFANVGAWQPALDLMNNHNTYFNSKLTYKKDGTAKAYDLGKHAVQNVLPMPDILDQIYNLGESKLRSKKKRRKNRVIQPRSTPQELVNFLLNVQTYDKAKQREKVIREKL